MECMNVYSARGYGDPGVSHLPSPSPLKGLTLCLCFPSKGQSFTKFLAQKHQWDKNTIKPQTTRDEKYQLGKCHNRRSPGYSLSIGNPQLHSDTAPTQAHTTLSKHLSSSLVSALQSVLCFKPAPDKTGEQLLSFTSVRNIGTTSYVVWVHSVIQHMALLTRNDSP